MWCRDRFSPDAQLVMQHAHAECDGLEHRYFGAEHVLLGVLHGQGPAAHLLHGYGISLPQARTEIQEIVAATIGTDAAAQLSRFGIDVRQIQERIETNFGTMPVLEASHRVARRPWWRGGARPVPASRKPFLIKRAMETADRRARTHATLVRPEDLLYGIARDCREPVGSSLSRRHRAGILAQIGMKVGTPHPVQTLLEAHGISTDEICRALDHLTRSS